MGTTCTTFTVNLEMMKSWTSLVKLGNLLHTIDFVLLSVPGLISQFFALLATHALMCLFPVESVVYSLVSYLLTFYCRICKSAPRKFTSSTSDSYLF